MSLHPALDHATSPYYGDPKNRKVVQRWAALAEQRFDHLTELFDSGRWRHFHTESEFLENIQEAKTTLERWRAMANGVFAPPVIRAVSPGQLIVATPKAEAPVMAAPASAAPVVTASVVAASVVAEPAAQHQAEVLSFEDHAAQREAARAKTHLVAMSDVIVNHADVGAYEDAPEIEPPVHAVSPLDLFDHDAIVARYPMLRAAM